MAGGMTRALALACTSTLALLAGCSPGPIHPDGRSDAGADAGTAPMDGLFTAAVTEVVLEVDYQPGAEPFTGLNGTEDTWELFRANAEALFRAAPRRITYPNRLDQMERLANVAGSDFTVEQILELAARHRQQASTSTRRTFYVLFLDGYLSQNGQRQAGVLGVSIGKTGVIAMFKPVIRSSGLAGTPVPRFVEQVTLVHELGHAVGLVANGLPLTSEHHDEAHGAHCSNRDCAMYYAVEGVSDLVSFVSRRVQTSSTVVFGDECLNDAAAAARP